MKRFFLGFICCLLIVFGAYKNYSEILGIGIIILAIILFFPMAIIRDILASYLKEKYKIDILKQAKDKVIEDLSKDFKMDEQEKNKIYASTTAGNLAITAAGIITSKRICPSCKKGEMIGIPWEEKFNKMIEGKTLASDPLAYKCDSCGCSLIQYDSI